MVLKLPGIRRLRRGSAVGRFALKIRRTMIDRRIGGVCTLVCAAILVSTSLQATSAASLSFTSEDRIVNLGDSHTDGQTYALIDAGGLGRSRQTRSPLYRSWHWR